MWPVILEKAFAKYHGNYGHTVGGAGEIATQTLTGSPYVAYYMNVEKDETKLWNALVTADKNNDMITCSTAEPPAG